MTGNEFRATLAQHGMSIPEFSKVSGHRVRLVRAWAYDERRIPAEVEADVLAWTILASPASALKGATDEVQRFRDSIARMCSACEPEAKRCRDDTCPLRPVSPLRMSSRPMGPVGQGGPTYGDSPQVWPPQSSDPVGITSSSSAEGAFGGGLA